MNAGLAQSLYRRIRMCRGIQGVRPVQQGRRTAFERSNGSQEVTDANILSRIQRPDASQHRATVSNEIFITETMSERGLVAGVAMGIDQAQDDDAARCASILSASTASIEGAIAAIRPSSIRMSPRARSPSAGSIVRIAPPKISFRFDANEAPRLQRWEILTPLYAKNARGRGFRTFVAGRSRPSRTRSRSEPVAPCPQNCLRCRLPCSRRCRSRRSPCSERQRACRPARSYRAHNRARGRSGCSRYRGHRCVAPCKSEFRRERAAHAERNVML